MIKHLFLSINTKFFLNIYFSFEYQLIYERIYTLYLSRYKKFNTLAFLSDPSILNKRIRFSSLHNFISSASSIFDREEISSLRFQENRFY